jgi:arginine/serine-rich splicing factor 18
MNFTPRVPLLPLPPSARPNSSDEDSLGASSFSSMPSIDASKRKNLPAWIREGLEKMEKEKQKKEEREKFLLERELRRKKELESGGQGDLAVTRSRFDDSEEEEEDDTADEIKSPLKESTPTAVPNAQTLEDIVNSENSNKFRFQLTILLSDGKDSSTYDRDIIGGHNRRNSISSCGSFSTSKGQVWP